LPGEGSGDAALMSSAIIGGTSGAWLGTRLKVTLTTLPSASMSVSTTTTA